MSRPPSSRVRAATVEDADAIGEIHVRSWQSAYRGIVPDEYLDALDVAEFQARRRDNIAAHRTPGARWWVIEDAARAVGFAVTGPARDDDLDGETVSELRAIYLTPAAIGKGFGRELMQRAVDDARERGWREMIMWVLEGNERGRRFYAAAGFRPDERVEPKPHPGLEATKLRMVRSL